MKRWHPSNSTLPLILTAICLSGCSTVTEEVTITSTPAAANVTIDGKYRGVTPLTVEMATKKPHTVKVEKQGFNTEVQSVTPIDGPNADNFVRFGLLEDAGHYLTLSPNPMNLELVSSLIPHSRGVDPFIEFSNRVTQLDQMLDNGEITPDVHALIMRQLLAFYQ